MACGVGLGFFIICLFQAERVGCLMSQGQTYQRLNNQYVGYTRDRLSHLDGSYPQNQLRQAWSSPRSAQSSSFNSHIKANVGYSPKQTLPKPVYSPKQTLPKPVYSPKQTLPKPVYSPKQTLPKPVYSPQQTLPKPVYSPQQTLPKPVYSPQQTLPKPVYSPQQTLPKPVYSPQQTLPKPVYSPQQTLPKPVYSPQQTLPKPVYSPQQTLPKPVYSPQQTPSRTVYSPKQTPSRTVYSPKQTPSRTVYSPKQTPSRTVYSPKQTPSRTVYSPKQTPSRTVYSPKQTPSRTVYSPKQTPSRTVYSPKQTLPKTVYSPKQTLPKTAYSPKQTLSKPAYNPYSAAKSRLFSKPDWQTNQVVDAPKKKFQLSEVASGSNVQTGPKKPTGYTPWQKNVRPAPQPSAPMRPQRPAVNPPAQYNKPQVGYQYGPDQDLQNELPSMQTSFSSPGRRVTKKNKLQSSSPKRTPFDFGSNLRPKYQPKPSSLKSPQKPTLKRPHFSPSAKAGGRFAQSQTYNIPERFGGFAIRRLKSPRKPAAKQPGRVAAPQQPGLPPMRWKPVKLGTQ